MFLPLHTHIKIKIKIIKKIIIIKKKKKKKKPRFYYVRLKNCKLLRCIRGFFGILSREVINPGNKENEVHESTLQFLLSDSWPNTRVVFLIFFLKLEFLCN